MLSQATPPPVCDNAHSDRRTSSKTYLFGRLIVGGWLEHADGTYGVLVGDRDGDAIVFAGVVDIGIGAKLIEVLETIERKASEKLIHSSVYSCKGSVIDINQIDRKPLTSSCA